MKKYYNTPEISVINIENLEVISTSGEPKMSNNSADGSQQWGKHRASIWDDEE
ncbi:MAG: hypothetical protein J5543_07320 [Bacteroidales bacterium]|jgi:hypothetical protein|nr:hypothetical protein [Bacteroidales bacterium]